MLDDITVVHSVYSFRVTIASYNKTDLLSATTEQ